jgi:serine/threonine-protein kinase HipA
MIDRLEVLLFDRPTGDLAIAGPLRSPEDWTFRYHSDYLQSAAAVPLSVTLPLREDPYVGAVARNWFCNLLPEGAVRQAVVERLRLPPEDDFALLAAIGGECAGAVSVRVPGAVHAGARGSGGGQADLEEDLDAVLGRQGVDAGEGAWALAGAPLRLSLAGAQDKLAVVVDAEGRLRLPRPGEASTHLLKPDSLRFPGIRDAEALGLALARQVGLDAARARLVEVAGRPALLVERYDRIAAPDGSTRRLHQEDLCQALGYPERLKYEDRGGPGLADCSALLRRLALGPGALNGLLDWAVFNALIGNADAHAKNLSLLTDPQGRRRLAPLYDLVPTIYLPESMVERTPAMRIGAATRIDRIGAQDWRAFAGASRYAPGYVLKRVEALADAVLASLHVAGADIVAQGGREPRVARVVEAVATNTRRIRDALHRDPGAAAAGVA